MSTYGNRGENWTHVTGFMRPRGQTNSLPAIWKQRQVTLLRSPGYEPGWKTSSLCDIKPFKVLLRTLNSQLGYPRWSFWHYYYVSSSVISFAIFIKGSWLTNQDIYCRLDDMVIPAGFEPSITALKGLRPDLLVEGTICWLTYIPHSQLLRPYCKKSSELFLQRPH